MTDSERCLETGYILNRINAVIFEAKSTRVNRTEIGVLKSDDVTVDALNEIINIAGCVTNVDQDGDIFVQEGLDFGVWVIIDRDKKCLVFRTYMRCKQDAPRDELDAYVASLNSKYYLAQFSYNTYENGQAFVNAHYFIFYNFGLIPGQVIFSLRTFAEVFIEAIKISDKDDKFFD